MFKLLEKIRGDQLALGIMTKGGPNLVRHIAAARLDFIIVDLMHSRVDWDEAAHICAMARADGLFPFVRLQAHPWGSGVAYPDRRFPVDAAKAFALGGEGVMWSIASAEEARMVAHLASDWHQGKPVTTVTELKKTKDDAKQTRLLIPLIESLSALEQLEEIISIEGISGIFMACTDLAQQLGHPHDYLHPDVLEAIRQAVAVAKKQRKIVVANTGYVFPSVEGQIEHARTLADMGVRMIMLQSCEFYLYFATKAVADGVRDAVVSRQVERPRKA